MHRFFSLLAAVSFFIFLLVFPDSAMAGAAKGLLLWYNKVLPVLLPFSLASHLLLETNLTGRIDAQWYVILTGFLCGYPMGAISTGILFRQGKISVTEARRLMLFCNQPSPMFLRGFLGIQCLKLTQTLPIIAAAYIPPVIVGIILQIQKKTVADTAHTTVNLSTSAPEPFQPLTIRIFESAWLESCHTLVKVGGYLMLFSILASWIYMIIPPDKTEGLLLIGMMEMTTGAALLGESLLKLPLRAAAGIFMVCFGGLSCLAQTVSCLPDIELNLRSYILSKLICGLCSAALIYIFLNSTAIIP